MLELEIQKLTLAIQELTVELRSAQVGNEMATTKKARQEKIKPAIGVVLDHEPVRDPAPEPKPEKVEAPTPDITADTIKTVAMEIVRADSSARSSILEILGNHNAKTIAQLDPKHYNSVHHELLGLAKNIFNKSEAV